MPDTQPTATVAGQSIALHITGYPDIPNRWGSGHIRPISIRLDYGNSRTPDGRHALVTGLWVREDGHATDDPVDRLYDAHNGDMSAWPDWLAELVKAHDPAAVPVSSPPPDQTALRDRIAEAVRETVTRIADLRSFDTQIADAVLAELPPPADRAAILREEADRIDATRAQFPIAVQNGITWATAELRRHAAECPQCGTTGACNGGPCPLRRPDAEEQPDAAPESGRV